MTKENITKQAQESYHKYFKDAQHVNQEKSEDVILDKEKLSQEIEEMKLTEEKKHESLEVLRNQLNLKAEESYEKTFGEAKEVEPKKKINTGEMYKELNEEKEHLTKMAEDLKQKELSKNK